MRPVPRRRPDPEALAAARADGELLVPARTCPRCGHLLVGIRVTRALQRRLRGAPAGEEILRVQCDRWYQPDGRCEGLAVVRAGDVLRARPRKAPPPPAL